jgi:hypothetical protein
MPAEDLSQNNLCDSVEDALYAIQEGIFYLEDHSDNSFYSKDDIERLGLRLIHLSKSLREMLPPGIRKNLFGS